VTQVSGKAGYRKQFTHKTTDFKGDINMKKSIILITALIAVGFLATQAFSWGPGKGMRGSGSGINCPGIDSSTYHDLSKAQQDELATLRQKFTDDTYELRASMMYKHNEIRLLMATSAPDRDALSRLSTELSDLMTQVQEHRIDFMLAAKKVAPELRFGQGMGSGFHKGYGKGNCPRTGQGSGPGQGKNYSGGPGYGCSRY
jgi:zinc resistance-associated protein